MADLPDKLPLFTDDTIFYMQKTQDTTKLVRINKFNKGCKTKTEKSDAFLYTNDEQSEQEIMKKILL